VRYTLKATGSAGPVEFQERLLTLDGALQKAAELGAAGFRHVTLVNAQTGVEIEDLEELVRVQAGKR